MSTRIVHESMSKSSCFCTFLELSIKIHSQTNTSGKGSLSRFPPCLHPDPEEFINSIFREVAMESEHSSSGSHLCRILKRIVTSPCKREISTLFLINTVNKKIPRQQLNIWHPIISKNPGPIGLLWLVHQEAALLRGSQAKM
jgi:hypothetical protein